MSSAQEPHLLPPPKPKLSPLELRNTDLVSRLLAATPPYLYNMSLLPNTYFFSEMLRSFVHAKNTEQRGNIANGFGGNNLFYGHQMRRSRKRAWSNMSRESYPQNSATVEEKIEKPVEEPENNEPWMIKSMRKSEDSALELTTNTVNAATHQKVQPEEHHTFQKPPKLEDPSPPFAPAQQLQESTSNLVLPPPPPMWYPPIYPTPPYGIDPLHFFIDLRVSGHIYDRQNNNSNAQGKEETMTKEQEKNEVKIEEFTPSNNIFNQKRHCSAFSVPSTAGTSKKKISDRTQTKFDVKSMGFDKGSNKTSTNYIMGNISNIYKTLRQSDNVADAQPIDVEHETTLEESEEEKQKKVKELKALIGLELVVDYMSNKKALVRSEESSVLSEEGELSSEDVESCASPHLEVVAVHDEA